MVDLSEKSQRHSARVDARKQRTRVAILEAAAELFSKQGYDATTMQEMATRADVGLGTLYGYFPSKEDVLRTVLDDRRREAAQRAAGHFAAAHTIPERICSMLEDLWRYFYDNRPLTLALFTIDAARPRPEHTGMEPIFNGLIELLKAGEARGQTATLSADVTARTLLSTYSLAALGLGIWHDAQDGEPVLEGLRALTMKLIMP